MSRIPKALFVALAVALGCATVLLHGFLQRCFSISMKSHSVPTSEPTNIVETTAAMDGSSEPPSKEDVKEVLDHLDTDHSGQIDFEEFSQLIKDVLAAMNIYLCHQ